MPRPTKSTARFIAYDLRPAKQSERGLLVDVLKVAGDCGIPIRDYKYIGMGANRFYDFLMLHKHLGVKAMVSLEHDAQMYERAMYNVPYRFIEVRNESVLGFLQNVRSARRELLWLDYDGGIGPEVVADIASVATRAKPGHFCFVTVSGHPPRVIESASAADRLTHLQENLGDFSGGVRVADTEKSSFATAVHKILVAAFKNAFPGDAENEFVFLLQVEYSDSMPMVTVGGGLLPVAKAKKVRKALSSSLPFLPQGSMYRIRSFHLTERERALFDRAVTGDEASPEHETLELLGFKEPDLRAYSELVRYLPRYVEAAV
ncbi:MULTISPECIES: O-methyltransferase [Stenotrophomonas]|uniref:O-methyltransferase n=1 Tax=Stenotrophomonas TaxID=40323 RepID=UPI0003807D8F|nr:MULTISPECIES: O-methyltransferase [Stenotrophomonas]